MKRAARVLENGRGFYNENVIALLMLNTVWMLLDEIVRIIVQLSMYSKPEFSGVLWILSCLETLPKCTV